MARKKKKGNVSAGNSGGNKSGIIVAVVAALLVGIYFGGVIVPAFQESSEPTAGTVGGAGSDQQISAAEKAVAAQPGSAKAWTRLGNLYFDSDQHLKAIDAYNTSLAIEPDEPHVLTDLGVMYRRHGDSQKAVEAFDRAIKASPEHETARLNKGIVLYYDLNDKAGAIQAWQGLVDMNPQARTPSGKLVRDMIRDLS